MLMLYNAVANNGKMMKPYLVNAIRDMGHEVESFQPTVLVDKICSDETLAKLKDCLLAVVEEPHGTAYKLKTGVYQFAGKTGTAAVTAMDNRGYNKGNKIYQSSFIGYFPADHPKYSIAVVIQNTSESRLAYGGVVSAPVFRDVADRIYASKFSSKPMINQPNRGDSNTYMMYGLKPDLNRIVNVFQYASNDSGRSGDWRTMALHGVQAELSSAYNNNAVQKKVPDVTGLGLKDAVYLLENMGLKVIASGRGKVSHQSLAENVNFVKGQSINIELN